MEAVFGGVDFIEPGFFALRGFERVDDDEFSSFLADLSDDFTQFFSGLALLLQLTSFFGITLFLYPYQWCYLKIYIDEYFLGKMLRKWVVTGGRRGFLGLKPFLLR